MNYESNLYKIKTTELVIIKDVMILLDYHPKKFDKIYY